MEPVVLKPGDCLLYRPTGLLGWLIATKTWHRWGHCETYVGDGKSVGSRDTGVNLYPVRWSKLGRVMRPVWPFDLKAAMAYFATVKGTPYDALGLLRFFRVGSETGTKLFCSELCTRFYRAGGLDPFDGEPADLVPPYYFESLADGFLSVWSDGK